MAPVVAERKATLPLALQELLKDTFGFELIIRTLKYIVKRLEEFGYAEQPHVLFQKIFTEERLQEFKNIFRELLKREAFENNRKRNVDAINAVNFAFFDQTQGSRIAKEELRSVLRLRKERSRW